VLPLISRAVAGAVGLPLAPLTIAAIFALTMRRALTRAPGGAESAVLDKKLQHASLSGAQTVIGT
jgi:hypothetical protein